MFECLQLVTNIGCFSAIDIIDNTLGGLIGWGIFKLIYKQTPKRLKTLSVVSIVTLAIAVPLAIFALVKTLSMWNFYLAILTKTY
jgi:glycopeptide antibiotics resistance protein